MVERFTLLANDVGLPEFIEIYIRSDLNIKLTVGPALRSFRESDQP